MFFFMKKERRRLSKCCGIREKRFAVCWEGRNCSFGSAAAAGCGQFGRSSPRRGFGAAGVRPQARHGKDSWCIPSRDSSLFPRIWRSFWVGKGNKSPLLHTHPELPLGSGLWQRQDGQSQRCLCGPGNNTEPTDVPGEMSALFVHPCPSSAALGAARTPNSTLTANSCPAGSSAWQHGGNKGWPWSIPRAGTGNDSRESLQMEQGNSLCRAPARCCGGATSISFHRYPPGQGTAARLPGPPEQLPASGHEGISS